MLVLRRFECNRWAACSAILEICHKKSPYSDILFLDFPENRFSAICGEMPRKSYRSWYFDFPDSPLGLLSDIVAISPKMFKFRYFDFSDFPGKRHYGIIIVLAPKRNNAFLRPPIIPPSMVCNYIFRHWWGGSEDGGSSSLIWYAPLSS